MSIRLYGRIIDCKGNFVFILPIVFRYSTITNLLQDPLKIKMLIPERGCESHPLFSYLSSRQVFRLLFLPGQNSALFVNFI